ncbi:ketopantoate reductase family protein [Alteromonas sp. A081]|uniref:ketopantoate reductase family protein n=1 Tax=Alteromonas sp. A081 TaxID=3410269 RepID=UPI003B983DB7
MTHLHIVGGGAIGSLLAAGAEKHQVVYTRYPRFFSPSNHNEATKRCDKPALAKRSSKPNESSIPNEATWLDGHSFPLHGAIASPTEIDANHVLIFPLKVYQLESALRQWLPFLHAKPVIVLLQNGMGGHEIARTLLGDDYPLLLATTSHGALKKQMNDAQQQLVYTGLGNTTLGSIKHPNLCALTDSFNADSLLETDCLLKTNRLVEIEKLSTAGKLSKAERESRQLLTAYTLLNRALPPVALSNNILHALWSKLAVNAVINPLTALNNVPNLAICDEGYSKLIHDICQEFVAVAEAYGENFDLIEIKDKVMQVAKATGRNFSSMHQDVHYKRQTEIDAINGYIVSMAQKKGISVPTNTLLVKRVKALLV